MLDILYVTHNFVAVPRTAFINGGNILSKFKKEVRRKAKSQGGSLSEYVEHVVFYQTCKFNGIMCLQFPRFCLAQLVANLPMLTPYFIDRKFGSLSIEPQLSPTFKPFDYQEHIAGHIMDHYFNEKRVESMSASCILKLGTGLGKTFISGMLIERLKMRTLYIVPLRVLGSQFADDMRRVFRHIRISENANADPQSYDVLVLVINTAIGLPTTFFTSFGFTIFDEIHRYAAPTQRNIFFRAKSRYSLGMTATPANRVDGLDELYYHHMGDIISEVQFDSIGRISPDQYFTFKMETRTVAKKAHASPVKVHGVVSFLASCRDILCYDSDYNNAIVNESLELYKMGRPHIIFTHIASHVEFLTEAVKERLSLTDDEITSLYGGGERQMSNIRNSSIVISTYASGAMGLSVVTLNAAIFATPPYQNSLTQTLGRITRKNADNPEADKIPRIIVVIYASHATWARNAYHVLFEQLEYQMQKNKEREIVMATADD